MSIPIGTAAITEAALILFSAFLAAGKSGLENGNESKLRKLAEDNPSLGSKLTKLLNNPQKYSEAAEIGLYGLGLLAVLCLAYGFFVPVDALFVRLFQGAKIAGVCAKILTAVLFLLIYFTFGVLLPKRAAELKPERSLRRMCGLICFTGTVLTPFMRIACSWRDALLRLLGFHPEEDPNEVTEEEIRLMVDIGGESGAIEQDERAMIENIFEFNNTTAADVMIHRMEVEAIQIEDPADEILKKIEESGLSRFPVYDSDIDDIVGILNTRDFLLNLQKDQPKQLRELLRPAYLVPETVPADTLFNDMQKKKVHLAVVVDEYGGMAGIVTMEDLLEEIVGNIYDEFDPKEEAEIEKLEDNLWRVKGTADLEELSEALDISLPLDEEYDTLGGMVFSSFASIPEDGARPEVTMYGLHIRIESIQDHRVNSALVSKMLPNGEETD